MTGTARNERYPDAYLSLEIQEAARNRLSSTEDHLHAMRQMLKEQATCEELLVQLAAVRMILGQVAVSLLEEHLDVCVQKAFEADEKDIKLILDSFRTALAQILKHH